MVEPKMQIAFITKVDLKNRLFIRISDWKHEKAGFQPFLGDFFFAFLEVFLKVSFDPKSLKPWEWRIIIILGLDKSQNPKLVLKNKNAHKKTQKNGVVESPPSEEATLKGHIFQSTWPIFPSFCRDIVQTSI